jgi:hypothetical protein
MPMRARTPACADARIKHNMREKRKPNVYLARATMTLRR